ncbi:MAG: hypothetical protein KDK75_12035 [Alphaproteobacteria bacterium]|nr:hypothetical protein [Alphaproteobacteria bacterium]
MLKALDAVATDTLASLATSLKVGGFIDFGLLFILSKRQQFATGHNL